jgi:hypothetical protein
MSSAPEGNARSLSDVDERRALIEALRPIEAKIWQFWKLEDELHWRVTELSESFNELCRRLGIGLDEVDSGGLEAIATDETEIAHPH